MLNNPCANVRGLKFLELNLMLMRQTFYKVIPMLWNSILLLLSTQKDFLSKENWMQILQENLQFCCWSCRFVLSNKELGVKKKKKLL